MSILHQILSICFELILSLSLSIRCAFLLVFLFTQNFGGGRKRRNCEKEQEKPAEVVHVRAKRGQATDSHSLAERVYYLIIQCSFLIEIVLRIAIRVFYIENHEMKNPMLKRSFHISGEKRENQQQIKMLAKPYSRLPQGNIFS